MALVKTLRLVAAALAAAALLGEEGCTSPKARSTASATATPSGTSYAHGYVPIGGGGGAAAAAAAAQQNKQNGTDTIRTRGGSNADESSSHASGFGESGGAHGSGG